LEVEALDLDAYLERVGYNGPVVPTESVLIALHGAQVFTIPFENLDIHLGRPIRLDVASLCAKLVDGHRGGYCYELTGLFLLVLRRLGFDVMCLAGRNMMRETPMQKSHQALLVTLGRRQWLVDLGFGGNGLIEPIPLEPDTVFPQFFDAFRLQALSPFSFVLQSRPHDTWQSLYAFTLEEYHPLDYAMMNYYNSTSPMSAFTQRRMAARPCPVGRTTLSDSEIKVRCGSETTTVLLDEGEPYRVALAEYFGIVLPGDAEFVSPLATGPQLLAHSPETGPILRSNYQNPIDGLENGKYNITSVSNIDG
jgi:N-hydroxyarylamine O-acetyltransferase